MRVLIINSVCGVGSTGRIVTDLYDVLTDYGHECCIAYGRGNAVDSYNTVRIGNALSVAYHGICSRITDHHGMYSKRATKNLIEKIKIFNPNIIHLHNIHGYYLNIELLFSFLQSSKIKVIWTLHDCWAFTGHCSHFDYIGCTKWKNQCFKCPQKKTYPKSIFLDSSSSNYKNKKKLFTLLNDMNIVTPSEWMATLARESFLGIYSINIINNGIDLSVFKTFSSSFKKKYGIENKFLILGVANIWSERKGLKYFYMLSSLLDDNYRIILIGAGIPSYLKKSKIINIKHTNSSKELAEIYNAADVFFNPTLEDNYPTTNLEALACGTPVITFNTGGSPEVITNKNCVIDNFDIGKVKKIIQTRTYNSDTPTNIVSLAKEQCFLKYMKLYLGERYNG